MTKDITTIKELKKYLEADFKANDRKRWSCGYRYIKWVRITRYLFLKKDFFRGKLICGLARCIRNHYGNKFGYVVPYRKNMGKGYSFSHNTGVIFEPESAGDYLIFRNFVVVGYSLNGEGNPIIGNYVQFGAGSKVIGNIRIGNNVVIGANAVVTEDVPDNSVVAGIPAKVIRKTKDRWGTRMEDNV